MDLLSLALVVSSAVGASPGSPPAAAELRIEVVDAAGKPVARAEVFTLAAKLAEQRYYEVMEREDRRPQYADLVERGGERLACDEIGVARCASTDDEVIVVAKVPGLLGFARAEDDATHVRVVCQADRTVVLRVLDASGAPCAGVDVVLTLPPPFHLPPDAGARFVVKEDPIYAVGGCEWSGLTGADGLARIEHTQLLVPPNVSAYVTLGIPMTKRELVRLDLAQLPTEPIEFRLPPTGRVVVEGPSGHGGRLMLRAKSTASGTRFWSNYAPCMRQSRDGHAEFPFVELGLELEARAWWPGLRESLTGSGPGPKQSGEASTLRIATPDWLREGAAAPRLIVVEDGREVQVRWVALTAMDSLNRQFKLCYEVLEGSQQNRHLQVVLGKLELNTSGSHATDSGAVHHDTIIAASNVDRIADAAGLAPARFVSRDVELRASLALDGDVGPHGRRVPLRLVVRNASSKPVRWVSGWSGLGYDPFDRWTYRVWRDGERVFAKPETYSLGGGLSMLDDLPPGESHEDRDDLAFWFDLSKPGRYHVSVEYYMNVVEPSAVFSASGACTTEWGGCAQVLTAECEFEVKP